MAFHIYQNLNYICEFYNEKSRENLIPIIKKINLVFINQQINRCIKIES
jgi:hypothetical protein